MSENKEPILCGILGVKVNQHFTTGEGILEREYYIDENGIPQIIQINGRFSETKDTPLFMAINDPSRIHKKPPLTEQEFAVCETAGAKWISMDNVTDNPWVNLWNAKPEEVHPGVFDEGEDENVKLLGMLRSEIFPSIKPGDCIKLHQN